MNKSLVSATPLSTAFFSSSIVQDFQDSPDDEEDTRSSQEYLNDIEEEYQHKPELRLTKDFEAKYNKVKAKLALLSSSASASKAPMVKNKGLITEVYEWDEEEVLSDDNEMVEVKILMALDEENNTIGKESARNSEWVKISMRKVHTLLEIEDNNDRKVCLDYVCIDLNFVEEQRSNLLSKHRNLVHELNTCKEQLLVLKQAKLDFLTMQHVNTEILKETKNLRSKLKELKEITKTWLHSSNKVNQCISEQISSKKKKILGVDQLTQDPSSSGQKDLVFVKSLAHDTKVTIPGVERPWLSEAEGFILPNHDTDESLICSTPLPPLKKLEGVEPISGPKTIKSILKSKSTLKAEALKGVIINEPSSAPAKGNKSSSASKVHSAPAGKLKSVKIQDDPSLAIVIKELNSLKLQVSKNHYDHDTNGHNMIISLEREINPRNPQHAFKRCEAYGSSNYTTTDHCDIEWFKRGEALQAKKVEALKSTRAESLNANRSKTPTKSGCSRHMTGVKSYLHKYVEQPGPKVVIRDDSTCTTEGYGSIKYNGIVFTKVSFVNGLKYNLISISQLCDAKYIVQFDEKRGTIFKSNKEIVMIAPRAFRDFNTKRQQTEEIYHITFDESPKAIKFSKSLVDNINIVESERYPPDEYLHPFEPSQRYQTNNNDVSFIEPYECHEPVVLETKVLSDQNGQIDQNDQSVQNDKILNDDHYEHSDHTNNEQIIDNLPKRWKNPPLPVPSMVTPAPQDKWSQDKHIELVNIIGNTGAGMLTRAMAKQLNATSAHECLFVDFLSEEEPKKVSEALKHPKRVDAMQDELNQFARKKV
ncbi:hypothetical protein Tco_0751258 [Tanacetum coccineum]|uniref:Retrovirus-related Pol polyprotein from transposon TNT 1-94-like beta-barrel domain-containing protein n=1 Tax=Tanacetum coccineum TaxID=301880 RepID=A0ABQ4Z6S8_9ASTR